MDGQRVQYGGCSFIPPDGFVIQKEASFPSSDTSTTAESVHRRKAPICVTLTSTAVHPDVQDFSESPEDMHPDAYPVTLTLNTFVAHLAGSALDYLRNTSEVLKKHFKGFQTDFCEEDTVGEFRAARAQSSYVTNFRIFQLHIVWLARGLLVTATMTVPESGVEKGWADLRSFVESVIL
ncbi:MAG: hypothetical protein PVF76_07720 [Syntrophobacterales bacterium]|jgi:hypothetical protein